MYIDQMVVIEKIEGEKRSAYQRRYRAERRRLGICHNCTNPTEFNNRTGKHKWFCPDCTAENTRRAKEKRQAEAQQRFNKI